MNLFQYYFGHCFKTGWREMWNNFNMWRDLISGNYEDYSILSDDNPYEECYQWFWTSINSDETLPKEFLEYLIELCNKINLGEVETIPIEDIFDSLD